MTPRHVARELTDESIEAAGLVRPERVRELLDGEEEDPQRREEQLYNLYVLHAWHRSFVREPPADVGTAIGRA